jgi:hypothetical protein
MSCLCLPVAAVPFTRLGSTGEPAGNGQPSTGRREAKEPVGCGLRMLRSMSLLLARTGPPAMSAIRSLSGVNRTWHGHVISVAIDPKLTSTSSNVALRQKGHSLKAVLDFGWTPDALGYARPADSDCDCEACR